jgi:flagellar hook-associated protein 1 FlgK
VNVDGFNIVDGADAVGLSIVSTGGTYRLLNERASVLNVSSGTIAETMRALNVDLPAIHADLDGLARALVTTVNNVHMTGTNPDGDTGVLFFDDMGDVSLVNAANFSLSAAVKASPRAIAAGSGVLDGAGTTVYAAGRNDIAATMTALRDVGVASLGGASAGGFYDSSVARLGQKVRAAVDDSLLHETLASQALIRRESVSGVSIDEELVALIRFQTAYTAATRVITAVDEMMESLLAMKR